MADVRKIPRRAPQSRYCSPRGGTTRGSRRETFKRPALVLALNAPRVSLNRELYLCRRNVEHVLCKRENRDQRATIDSQTRENHRFAYRVRSPESHVATCSLGKKTEKENRKREKILALSSHATLMRASLSRDRNRRYVRTCVRPPG